jgi:2',3'-cyclic-nucleotide 2'-phosphodiesterase (5'-nucleotidase family)
MRRLTILHTNDLHGRLPELARLTTVARMVRAEAEAQGRTVYRWDGGDAFDRRFEEGRLSRGAALPPVLAASGVTLQTAGNDIGMVYGMAALTRLAGRATYPMLAANLRDGEGPLVENLQESVLLDGPEGLKVGVFGLTDPWDGAYEGYGLHMPDEVLLAARLEQGLRAAGADVVILLSHLGLKGDRRMAAALPTLDLIIGAHSHDLLPEGEHVGRVLIAQAGALGTHLGRVDLNIGDDGTLVSAQAQVIEIPPETQPDSAVLGAMADMEREIEALRHEVVGHLTFPLTLDHFAESELPNFAAELLRQRAGADIGTVASGLFHAPLPAGNVTRLALANAAQVPANPQVSDLSGTALLAALDKSLDPAWIGKRYTGMRGSPVGLLGLSGVQVEVGPGPEHQVVKSVRVGGQLLDLHRTYRVAHTDLEPGPDSFFPDEGVTRVSADQSVLLEDLLREKLSQPGTAHAPLSAWTGLQRIEDTSP